MTSLKSSADALSLVFPPKVLERLAGTASEDCRRRHGILTASGPVPRDVALARTIQWRRGRKAAWEAYVSAGFACGLFAGDHGKELRGRLTGVDQVGFRSAMAECMASWVFAGVLRLSVKPRPSGRHRRVLEFSIEIPDGDANVEVKAPYRERAGRVWSGDDAGVLTKCLKNANKQFAEGDRNILVLVPRLRTEVFSFRYQLIRAFYGNNRFTVPINTETGAPAGPWSTEFSPEGTFLKIWKNERRFTRVSAVVCIEERVKELQRDTILFEPRILVMHNPFAVQRVSEDPWKPWPQLVKRGDHMEWTDGHGLWP